MATDKDKEDREKTEKAVAKAVKENAEKAGGKQVKGENKYDMSKAVKDLKDKNK